MPLCIRAIATATVLMAMPTHGASELALDTYLIAGATVANRQPDGNSTIIDAPAGLIIFDTGRHETHTRLLLEFARTRHRPIAAVINSHWHLDHVGGNLLLRAQYPDLRVYASNAIAAARTGYLADYRRGLLKAIAKSAKNPDEQQSMRKEVALIDAVPLLGPTEVIEESGEREIAGRPLQIHLESHAVTAGDVWIYDPATRILLAGDLVTLPAPFFETACPERWRQALAGLASTPFEQLVPGHGPPMRRKEFDVYQHAFSHLLSCATGRPKKIECIDGWIADAAVLIPSRDVSYARVLIDYYLEYFLRDPPERVQAFCRI